MKIKKLLCVMFLLILSFIICSGCMTPSEIYEKSRKYDVTDEQLKALAEGKLIIQYDRENFDSYFDYLKYWAANLIALGSRNLKIYAIPLIAVSIAIGLILMGLGRKSMRIRRISMFVFIIGIPVFIVCLIYASAFLADVIS